MRYCHEPHGSAPDVDRPLFETSTDLDDAVEFSANSFVFYYPQLVIYENKGLTSVFRCKSLKTLHHQKGGGGGKSIARRNPEEISNKGF
jgi:hypothetical protein